MVTAREHLEKAAAQFEASGLTEELEQTRLALQDRDRHGDRHGTSSKTKKGECGSETYPDRLTQREVAVLRLIAAGWTNNEIAADLVISVPTVESHITRIYAKISARGRADATAYALKHELV